MHTKPRPKPKQSSLPVIETLEQTHRIFQAIGIVEGEVTESDGKYEIVIAQKRYRLRSRNKKAIATTADSLPHKLIVYPRVIHFPNQQPPIVEFQLFGRVTNEESGVAAELKPGEFKLSGLWQYIPVCRTPCITIQRNATPLRIEYIKRASSQERVAFMRATHLPTVWANSPTPFRFNPRKTRDEQGKALFVQARARFNPDRNIFEVFALVSPPTEDVPPFLKAGKRDKAEAVRLKRQASVQKSYN